MVVEVFVAERDAEHPLPDERAHAVLDEFRRPPVLKAGGKAFDMARSVAPRSRPPMSDVIAQPSNPAATRRPSTEPNRSNSGLHSVGIGEPLLLRATRASKTTFADSE
jgi:hypothetical protein